MVIWVIFDGNRSPLKANWALVRLEKLGLMWEEQRPPYQQRPTETAHQFQSRKKQDLYRRRRKAVAVARQQAARGSRPSAAAEDQQQPTNV